MGDDRYADSAVLCQFQVPAKHGLNGSVPILLPLIETLFGATCSACLGSSKGDDVHTDSTKHLAAHEPDRPSQPRSCDSDTECFVWSINR